MLMDVRLCAKRASNAYSRFSNVPPQTRQDYGWANAGYHRTPADDPHNEVRTPNIDALVATGVQLDRFYVHKFCSPTRSALQSGRSPIFVNVQNSDIAQYNPSDPVSGFQGIPRNITGLAAKMKTAGYQTHMVGKWWVRTSQTLANPHPPPHLFPSTRRRNTLPTKARGDGYARPHAPGPWL